MSSQQASKKKNRARGAGGGRGMKPQEERFFKADAVGKPIISRRKLTYVTTDTAGTGAPLTFGIDSGGVTSCTEWANLSANYQQYRVRAIRARLVPLTRDSTNSAALVWYPGTIVSGSYPSGSGASTVPALFAEDGSKLHPEWTIAEHTVTWESNQDAKLWTDCNASIPALSKFACQFRGTVPAVLSYNTIVTHDVFVEFDVEFLGRN